MMNNQQDRPSIPVTDATPRPGDFPLGSPASRAAARAFRESRLVAESGLQIHISYGACPELDAALTAVVNDERAK
jgi:hypothetical protein